jgi:replicative DNA helicase
MGEARLRQPPHSADAEQGTLGAVLMDNAAWDSVGDVLEPADFYDAQHAAIFGTIGRLVMSSKPADVLTVHEAGGHDLVYLNALAQSVPSARNARAYALVVREHAVRRHVFHVAQQLGDDALAAALPAADVVDAAVSQLLALIQGAKSDEPTDLPELLARFVDELNASAQGKTDAISTGLADLDRLTAGGGRPGELWVVGARPSMGKTAFVLSLSRHVGRTDNVLVLTMEDSSMSAATRYVASAGDVNLADLRNPRGAPDTMWAGVAQGVDSLQGLRISIDDQPALSMAAVRRKVQQVTHRHGPLKLLVVDYLQMMDGEGENRNRELGAIAYGLQALAKKTGCWVVLLSQLSREADKRSGPPQMGDLRDSGDIEAAARCICMLYREHMRKPTEANKFWAQLHVCKQSNGPTDTLNLHFDGARQRFGNWAGPVPWSGRGE